MPAPTISAASSILGFRRNEPWQFQPGSTNAPTSWAISPVPAGITINSSTGLVTCTGIAVPGPIVFTLTATNVDGSASREFVAGISPEIFIPATSTPDAADEWTFDFVTRVLKPGTKTTTAQGAPVPESVIAKWKSDDKFVLRLRMLKAGAQIDPDPTAIKLVTKERDDESAVTVADDFVRSGATGDAAYFDLLVDLTDQKVKTALGDKITNAPQTAWDALVQLQVEYPVTFNAVATTMRVSSQTVLVQLSPDFVD